MIRWSSVCVLAVAVLCAYSYDWMGSKQAKLAAAKAANDAAGSLEGRSAIVVGGTAGIGRAVALRLAAAHADVAVVGRNADRGKEVVAEMDKTGGKGRHLFVKGDAMLLTGADESAANAVQALGSKRLDYLVLCQTIATTQGRTLTAEGIDQKLSLHIYSRVRYIMNLLPLMKATAQQDHKADVRVLSVLSAGVHKPFAEYKTDTGLEKDYTLSNAANIAGFYNDLALDALAVANPDVTFVHAAPGFVDTNWGSEMPFYIKGPVRLLQATVAKPASACAEWMCTGLLDPKRKGGLRLIGEFGQDVNKTALHTPESRDFVWNHIRSVLDKVPVKVAAAVPNKVEQEEKKE